MKRKNESSILLSLFVVLIAILAVNGTLASKAEYQKLPKAVFHVS